MNVHEHPLCPHVPGIIRAEALLPHDGIKEWTVVAIFLSRHWAKRFAETELREFSMRIRDGITGEILFERIIPKDMEIT